MAEREHSYLLFPSSLCALCSRRSLEEKLKKIGLKSMEKRRLWADITSFTWRQYLHFAGGTGSKQKEEERFPVG